MEKQYNILMAIPYISDNKKSLIDVRQNLLSAGIGIKNIEARGSKALVKQYLKQHQDTDLVILTQYPGNNAAPYSAAEIDELSMLGANLMVIPIIDDEVDADFLRDLEGRGIYTALFAKDANFKNIAEIIKKGRNKKAAREYYKLMPLDDLSEGSEQLTPTIQKAFDMVVSYDGTQENLIARMNAVSENLQSTEIKKLLSCLPPNVFAAVRRIDRFQLLCDIVEQSGGINPIAVKPDDEIDLIRGGKKGKKKEARKESAFQQENDKKHCLMIGVYSTDIGIGCTYSSLLFANGLKSKNNHVAVVEIDNSDMHFEQLFCLINPEKDAKFEKEFKVLGVTYIFNTDIETVIRERSLQFDYIIFDLGYAPTDVITHYFRTFDKNVVITSCADWHYSALHLFLRDIDDLDKEHNFIYFVPFAGRDSLANIKSMIPQNYVEVINVEENPFRPSHNLVKKTQKFLGSWQELPPVKVRSFKGIPFVARVRHKGKERIIGLYGTLMISLAFFMFGALGTGMVALDSAKMQEKETAYITDKLNMQIEQQQQEFEAIAERVGGEDLAYVLSKDVHMGDRVLPNDYQQEELLLEMDDSLIVSDIIDGSLYLGDFPKGTVLVKGMIMTREETENKDSGEM